MKALTAAEMRDVDRLTTERFAISGRQLMEAAGASVASVVLERFLHGRTSRPKNIAVLCGKGNNGGDGFVAARYLQKDAGGVRVYLFGSPEDLRGEAAANLQRWQEIGGDLKLIRDEKAWESAWPEVAASGIIVDALLGTGLRGPAAGLVAQAIEDVNRLSQNATAPAPALVVAVDTPSGLPSDGEPSAGAVLRAHLTVTFTAPKIGQLISRDAACCGQLLVRGIGSPEALVEEIGHGAIRWAGADEFASLPLVRAADAHKGSFGHVLVVAGSLGKSGAAILAAQGALRGGAGLVTIATPDVVLPMVAGAQPEYMTEPLRSTTAGTIGRANFADGHFLKLLEGKSVVAVGPGLGAHQETQEFARSVVQEASIPVVLDADGLNAFSASPDALAKHKTQHLVITPHPGEMARLLGTTSGKVQEDRVKTAVGAARRWNMFVVLKGFHTVLASPDGAVFINTTGNAGLAKGGSGDVLAGLLAAVTVQFGTQDWLRVLALGVYLHGSAADNACGVGDPSGLLAGEVALAIPIARQLLIQELGRRG
jgi:hydroxyethylthiazole kinase-like uncharacterized protein yjeF